MIKKVLLTGLLTLFFGTFAMQAQDVYLSETSTNDAILIQAGQNATLSNAKRTPNKFAVAPLLAYNGNKLGAGLRFSYDFTDVLRFCLDGNYYFYTTPTRRFLTITQTGEKGTEAWGRMFDVNPNLNFVYGNGNFHFYVIAGLYFSIGYSQIINELDGLDGSQGVYINKQYYYYKEKLDYGVGIGINGGCGIEFQITDGFRLFFDQQLSLGLMTAWMAKLGGAFCF